MRVTIFLLLISILQTFAKDAYSQKTKLSFDFSNKKLVDALYEIEENTEFFFLYNDNLIDTDRRINLSVDGQTIDKVLDGLFSGTDIKYIITDRKIILTPDYLTASLQQEMSISGKVTDSSGAPLPGVTVVIKGTTQGTITDGDGNYSLPNVREDVILVFSFVGMKTQEIPVSGKTNINVVMEEETIGIEEVVAIGYGTQKKRDLTGAVSQVKSGELSKMAVTGFDQAIAGRASGVQVTQNSGEPGGSVSIRIRGVGSINNSSEPLYVIDGVPTEGGLNVINVSDIESIDILKDASSAAIYGSRAANGVILVTTKRGVAGKVSVNFNAYYGVATREKTLDVLNTAKFVELANEAFINTQNDPRYTNTPGPSPYWSNPSALPDTKWQDLIFQSAIQQKYDLRLSGGTEKFQSSFSAGYLDQEGIALGTGYKRYTVRMTGDYNATDKLKFGSNVNVSREYKKGTNLQGQSSIVQQAYQAHPTLSPYTDQEGPYGDIYYGYKGYNFYNTQSAANPAHTYGLINNILYFLNEDSDVWNTNWGILGSVFGEYEIVDGLTYRSTFNINKNFNRSWYHTEAIPPQILATASKNSLSTNIYSGLTWNWINTINYSKTIGKHSVNLLAGTDAIKYDWYSVGASGRGLPSINNLAINIAGEKNPGSGNQGGDSRASYIGRANYTFADKYLFTFNIRRDGSSKFGPNRKWGTFPSAAIGWRASEESFLESVEWLSNLKLRGSWGIVGNDRIPNYQYLSTFSNADPTYPWGFQPIKTTFGSPGAQYTVFGYSLSNLANEDIHWEESHQYNVGLDIGLFGKLNVVADYYIKEIRDMLGYEPVPITFGAPRNTRFYNFASMRNSGFELDLNYNNQIGALTYGINANFSTLKNEVTDIGLSSEIIATTVSTTDNNLTTRTVVGEPIGYFYGMVTDGIFQNQAEIDAAPTHPSVVPGDRRYKDVNEDGKIDFNDRVQLGNGLPKYLFGLNLTAEYKNFDFSAFFQGQAGVKIANANIRNSYSIRYWNGAMLNNVESVVYDERWTGQGTSNTMPRVAYQDSKSNWWFSDAYIEDGSFVRLKSLQIGYTLPKILTERIDVGSVRFYVSGQNLFTITKYTGLDPDIGSQNQNVLLTGIDNGRYPLSRTILFGLNVGF